MLLFSYIKRLNELISGVGGPNSTGINFGLCLPPPYLQSQLSSTPLYVVIADDDPEDHQLVKYAIRFCDHNHVVSSVFNGQQLLDLLFRRGYYKHEFAKNPDVIILDVRMPIMSGIEALQVIKNDPSLSRIPIYILSDHGMEEDIANAIKLGANDYFKKPINFSDLKQVMAKVCEHVSANSRISQ